MAEIVIGIASLVVSSHGCVKDGCKLLWRCCGDHFRGCFFFNDNIAAFQHHLLKLTPVADLVADSVTKADGMRRVVLPGVREWQAKASELMAEARALNQKLSDGNNTKCLRCTGRKAIRLARQIEKLLAGMDFDARRVTESPPVPPPIAQPDYVELETTKAAKEAVLRALREEGDDYKIVSLYGMAGVGKTSLAKHVQLEVLREGLFQEVAFAVVSQTPRLLAIQTEIAESLGIALSGTVEHVRAQNLKEKLDERENMLLILDDIWKDLPPDSVGIPSRDQINKNCKILLTTRNDDVCAAMSSPAATITLGALSPDDSWTLFKKAVDEDIDDPQLHDLANEVVKECKGLPIALTTIGKALRRKKPAQWRATADRLVHSEPGKKVTDCIKLSYDFLAENGNCGLQAQQCFLMCCLFPEDYNVPTESLVRYGMGLGVFERDGYSVAETRIQVEDAALRLMECSLLLLGEKEGTVKMHDVIRDVAIQIAYEGDHKFMVEAGRVSDRWEERIPDRCTAISLMFTRIEYLPDELQCPGLKLLLLQDNPELTIVPDAFFNNANALTVLDLGQVQISQLPRSVGSLSSLVTLCIDHFKSETLSPAVGNLKKLQILSLREARITSLPHEIHQLTTLRILDLTLSTITHIPYGILPKLSRLEELYMKGSFATWEKETGSTNTIASFNEVAGLRKLKTLTVDILDVKCIPENVKYVPKWEKFNIYVCGIDASECSAMWEHHPVIFSKDIVLTGKIDMLPNWFTHSVIKTAEKLTYNQTYNLYDILPEQDGGNLANLNILSIEQCLGVTCLMNAQQYGMFCKDPVFKTLKELYIQHLSEMEQICVGQLPDGSFGSLTLLEVRQCDNLVGVLLPPNLLGCFKKLEKLDVSGIYVTHVFGCEGLMEGSYLREMKEMRLRNLPRLISIWNGYAQTVTFKRLIVVEVRECDKLTCLFTMTISKALDRLEDLLVENCLKLKEIVSEDGSQQCKGAVVFPNLKSLTLKSLKELTRISATTSVSEFSSRVKLRKEDCPKLVEA